MIGKNIESALIELAQTLKDYRINLQAMRGTLQAGTGFTEIREYTFCNSRDQNRTLKTEFTLKK